MGTLSVQARTQTWYFVFKDKNDSSLRDIVIYTCKQYWTDAEKYVNYSSYNKKEGTGTQDNNYTVIADYCWEKCFEDYINDLYYHMRTAINNAG